MKQAEDNKVLLSVITPVHNGRHYLGRSLPAIRESDYPHFELIVVDDNSTDGSRKLSEKYADVVIKMETREAPGKARNRGVLASKGSILLFVDADVRVAPDTISRVAKAMQDEQVAAVFGSYDDDPFFKNFFSRYKNLFHHFVHQNSNPRAVTFWSGCGAIRRDVFLEAGGFPEWYSFPSICDVELGYRLTENGKKIRLLKELQVKHLKRWSFGTLLKADILYRAVPWTKLACQRGLPHDLNFKNSDRTSGVLACLLFLSFVMLWFWKPFGLFSAILMVALLFLNWHLYRFFLRKEGVGFTLRAVLFHWFYFLYSSLTFIVVSVLCLIKKSGKNSEGETTK